MDSQFLRFYELFGVWVVQRLYEFSSLFAAVRSSYKAIDVSRQIWYGIRKETQRWSWVRINSKGHIMLCRSLLLSICVVFVSVSHATGQTEAESKSKLLSKIPSVKVTGKASFQGLGDLPGGRFSSYAFAVSADGLFVVGASSSTLGSEAFLWTKARGMRGLGGRRSSYQARHDDRPLPRRRSHRSSLGARRDLGDRRRSWLSYQGDRHLPLPSATNKACSSPARTDSISMSFVLNGMPSCTSSNKPGNLSRQYWISWRVTML